MAGKDAEIRVHTELEVPGSTRHVEVHRLRAGATAEDWCRAPAYTLTPASSDVRLGEPGQVRFAWRDSLLSIRFELTDACVVSAASADNQWHYELGDTAEWFLQPVGRPYYWEFYATPNGFATALRWPGGPRTGVNAWDDPSALRLATGRFSEDSSVTSAGEVARGAGWWAELSVDAALLCSAGDRVGPGSDWRTLAARYNHRVADDPSPELSCHPSLGRADFHQTSAYAAMRWC
jgi:hypothetical protein